MEINWEPVEPKVYRKGGLYQHPSYDCEQKFIATYEDDSKYAIPCNGDGTLTWQETRPDDKYKSMIYADIGLCVNEISTNAFNGCEKLTGWTKWDNVQTIGYGAFQNCTSLTDVPTAPNIGAYAYANCSNLPLVVLPSGIKAINNHTFFQCKKLESADLPNGLESIGTSAFYRCEKLTGMTIPNSVKTIGYRAFSYCYSATRFVIGTGITSIDNYAFANCLDLLSITINAINPPTIGNNTFSGDYPIYVPASSVNAYKSAWPQYYADRIFPIT